MVKQSIRCAHDTPIRNCTEHWPEFCEITGYTIDRRALEWALGDATGSSSQTLCRFMLGITQGDWPTYPADLYDRRRCIELLRLIPEWLPRLPELAAAEPGRPSKVNGIEDHQYGWTQQIPLILQEGGF